MAPRNTIRLLLFITALCLVASVNARIARRVHEQPENQKHRVPAVHGKKKHCNSTNNVHADSDLKSICDKTANPTLCVSSLSPFVKGKGKVTVDVALDASIQAGTSYAKYVLDQIKILDKKPPPEHKSIYQHCMYFYQNAMDDFTESLKALPARDIGRINSELGGVMTWLSTCEDEFDDFGVAHTLGGYRWTLTSMASVSLSLVGQLK